MVKPTRDIPKEPEQEPVDAVLLDDMVEGTHPSYGRGLFTTDNCVQKLYTTPPQRTWEGLSVFEINDLVANTEHGLHDLVERTEAKLKEKNT